MCASRDDWRCARSMHEFSAKDIDGHMVNLDKYRGFVCIVTNFGKQEPGSNEEIKEFAAGYNVKFDMFSKICVNGDDAHPLWKWMKIQPKGKGILGKTAWGLWGAAGDAHTSMCFFSSAIKWNFTKFLIDKNGCVVKRYGPMEEPLVIEKDLPHYF
ncbi:GPX4 isoform 3 [Pongo abelii]|uniref:phospholipid-hydroperoxide glutathione peroxidase n=1 Tax=Pongo abelii TaxID=9601 RepID=A0A2J8R9V8_PONAB|nr:GPX4 isoform 3 [Pongo abelii]